MYVNGIKEKDVGQVSPDVCSQSDCEVTLCSAVTYTQYLANGTYGFCFDLNSDLAVSLTDGVLLTPSAANADRCN